MAERFPIENLKVVGNSVYRRNPDGRMEFVRPLSQDPTANMDVFAATPPRADSPTFYGSTPEQGYFGQQAVEMAVPHLQSAYDLASSATTMTPDPNSYAPEAVQRMGHAATNYGIAGLQTIMAPFYGAAGVVGDVAKAAGVPRSEALTRDMGAMLDTAGILPEGRILSAMADAGAVGKVAGDAKRAVNTAVEKAPVVYADAIGNARALAQGDLEFMRGRGLPSESAAAGAQVTGQGTGAGAIIRPDDVFRGNGSFRNNVESADAPFAYRLTGQSQIEDMIQSGMVRPKEGGYGQAGENTVHYGAMTDAVPKSVFNTPKTDPNKGFTIVADKAKIAGKEGPATLDDLQHIWTMRNGQMVDILDEVKAKNRDYGAAPGIGDNGGPEMDNILEDNVFETPTSATAPRPRYVDLTTGRYSKAFEAAQDLTQNVMTPAQARAGLIKQGVSEEELLYTGFDNWLQGKDKVTKDEVVNILADVAINKSGEGSLPFKRITHEGTGITGGGGGQQLQDLQDQVLQDRMMTTAQFVDDYAITLRQDLEGQGFQRITSVDQPEDLQNLFDLIAEADSKGLYVDSNLRRKAENVQEYLNRGENFYSPSTRRSRMLLNDASKDIYIAPDGGSLLSENTAFEHQFPDHELPGDMRQRMEYELQNSVEQMDAQQVADYLGLDVNDLLPTFNTGTTTYSEYGPKGLMDYRENRYGYDDAGRGVISGSQKDLGTIPYSEYHFPKGSQDENRMYHARAGMLNTPEGKAYLAFELQSDVGQAYRSDPSRFHVTGTSPTFEIPKASKKGLQEYVTAGKKYQDLKDQESAAMSLIYSDKYLDPATGKLMPEAEGFQDLVSHIRDLRAKRDVVTNQLMDIEKANNDVIDGMQRFYGRPGMSIRSADAYGEDFDIKAVEEALAGGLKPRFGSKGSTEGRTSTRPFTTSTNRWVPAALKDELFNAANSDAEWFSLPLGKDVESWTYGESAGQADFYENIVPTQLKKLLKKEFGLDVPIEKIKAEGFLKRDNPTYEVNAIRLTPELRKMILEQGFSTFKEGGPVVGSSLDGVDVFALH